MSHAVVRLCNWQRSNVLADWAKNPDKPPIFENPPGRPDKGQKRGRVRGNPDVYGNPIGGPKNYSYATVFVFCVLRDVWMFIA